MLVAGISCKKNDYIEKNELPPITQTGANSFGCLVDGGLFLSRTGLLYSPLSCSYIYNKKDGYRFFSLDAKGGSYGLYIRTINKVVTVGEFDLGSLDVDGAFSVKIYDLMNEYLIEDNNKGKIKITKFDETNNIISATFWFDAVNRKGEKLEVREGRFDMRYRYTENNK